MWECAYFSWVEILYYLVWWIVIPMPPMNFTFWYSCAGIVFSYMTMNLILDKQIWCKQRLHKHQVRNPSYLADKNKVENQGVHCQKYEWGHQGHEPSPSQPTNWLKIHAWTHLTLNRAERMPQLGPAKIVNPNHEQINGCCFKALRWGWFITYQEITDRPEKFRVSWR